MPAKTPKTPSVPDVPLYDSHALRAALKAMDRDPFKELLARLLEAHPSHDDLRDLARRYPEKWAQAVATVGHLAGFHDKLEVEHSHSVVIAQMSDSELYRELNAAMGRVNGGELEAIEESDDGPAT